MEGNKICIRSDSKYCLWSQHHVESPVWSPNENLLGHVSLRPDWEDPPTVGVTIPSEGDAEVDLSGNSKLSTSMLSVLD